MLRKRNATAASMADAVWCVSCRWNHGNSNPWPRVWVDVHALAISVQFACLIKYVCITICRAHIATPNHVLDAAFAMQLHLCVHVVIKYYTHRSCCRCSGIAAANDTFDVIENEKPTTQCHVHSECLENGCFFEFVAQYLHLHTQKHEEKNRQRKHELLTTIKSNFKGKSLCVQANDYMIIFIKLLTSWSK